MARRYLALAEARLGVRFPDSYSEVFRTVPAALSRFKLGELWAPGDCKWIEDEGYADTRPPRTMLVIGMFHRGDARPLVMMRPSAEVAELESPLYALQGSGPRQVASSLMEAMRVSREEDDSE